MQVLLLLLVLKNLKKYHKGDFAGHCSKYMYRFISRPKNKGSCTQIWSMVFNDQSRCNLSSYSLAKETQTADYWSTGSVNYNSYNHVLIYKIWNHVHVHAPMPTQCTHLGYFWVFFSSVFINKLSLNKLLYFSCKSVYACKGKGKLIHIFTYMYAHTVYTVGVKPYAPPCCQMIS